MTFEEIKEAIAKADTETRKKLMPFLAQTEEGQTFNTRLAKVYSDEQVQLRDRHIYTQIDEKLVAAGFEKPSDGTKTSDWILSIAGNVKTLGEQLEAAKSSGNVDKKTLQQMEALQTEIKQLKDTYTSSLEAEKTKFEELHNKYVASTKTSQLDKALVGINFKNGLDQELIRKHVDFTKQSLVTNSRVDENGNVIWCKVDGTPIKGANGIENATLEEVLKSELSYIIQTTESGGGANNDHQSNNGGNYTGGKLSVNMEGVKTQLDFQNRFNEAAAAKGLARDSDDFKTQYHEALEANKIGDLPDF